MTKKNIIFILIDALRKDHLSTYGYPKKTTPNIDKIAEKSVIFNNAFSCINATDPSITSIFTGKYPHNHGINNHGYKITKKEINNFLNKKLPSLQSILKQNGYKTYGLDWLGRWHKKGFDFYLGISDRSKKKKIIDKINKFLAKITSIHKLITKAYHSRIFNPIFEKIQPYPNGKKLTDKALEIIKKEKNPFFMFIHYWDVHAPYNCPNKKSIRNFIDKKNLIPSKKYINKIKDKGVRKFYQTITNYAPYLNETLARYDACTYYVDQHVKRIIDLLKNQNKLDNTILIFTSDHGESLIEHNILFDHHGLYDCSIRVPLILKKPRQKQKIKINQLFQHTDLLPTLLDLLEIKHPNNFDGSSFISKMNSKNQNKETKREYIFLEEHHLQQKQAVRTKEHKLILSINPDNPRCERCDYIHGGINEFYNLEKDPYEKENKYSEDNPKVQKLKKILLKEMNKKETTNIVQNLKI